MGIITRLLHRSLGLKPNRYNSFRFDIGENIHLHYRDLRVEFSVAEFLEFHDLCLLYLPQLKAEIDAGYRDGVHPNTNQHSTWKEFYNKKSLQNTIIYNANRISLEENSDGYHVHVRNYKLLLDKDSFYALASAARDALDKRESELTLAEALELIDANELPHRVDNVVSRNGIEEAVATIDKPYFRKAGQVLTAVGFTVASRTEHVTTYRKGAMAVHLKAGNLSPGGGADASPSSVFALDAWLRDGVGRVSAAEINLIKLQILDFHGRMQREGRAGAAELRHERLFYDAAARRVIFPVRLDADALSIRDCLTRLDRYLGSLGYRGLKPAKIPYPAEEQQRLQDVFRNHLTTFVAANPCVRAIHLFGGGAGKADGWYEVPYVHFDWVKLGSDLDILIEIDESQAIPSGWEFKFFWEPSASGYYHLGNVDFPVASRYVEEYPHVDFYHHMIEAYLFMPSKGDAAVKDAFIAKFKGECIYRRDAAGSDPAALGEFLSNSYGLTGAQCTSLAPPSFNEVYRVTAGAATYAVKLMRRRDFTPALPGHRGEHLEYEAALLSAMSGVCGSVLLPLPGRDGNVLQAWHDRFCMLFPFVHATAADAPVQQRIDAAAAALAAFHDASARAVQVESRAYLFETAARQYLDNFAALFDRFKGAEHLKASLRHHLDVAPARIGALCEDAALPRTHCHGDVCPGNFFFVDGGAILFDFQSANWGPRIADVAEGALEFAVNGDAIDTALVDRFVAAYDGHSPLSAAERAGLPAMLYAQAIFRLARIFNLSVNFGYRTSASRFQAFALYALAHRGNDG